MITASLVETKAREERRRSVAVLIVTHNGAPWIRQCLESVRHESVSRVLVVDNRSSDDTVAIIEHEFPEVEVIRLHRNEGFGRANNIGIQHALDRGAEYICLLNQDLIVESGCIGLLVDALTRDPDLALAAALQLEYDGAALDSTCRQHLPQGFWDDLLLRNPADAYYVPFAPAAAMAVHREDFLEIGGFDPLFFLYGEDGDLCDRLQSAGRRIAIVPKARVRHWHGVCHHIPSLSRQVNAEYSQLLLHLKRSKRPFISLCGWMCRGWRRSARISPARIALARCVALWKCLARWRTIRDHKRSVPFSFRRGQFGPTHV